MRGRVKDGDRERETGRKSERGRQRERERKREIERDRVKQIGRGGWGSGMRGITKLAVVY